MTCENRYKNMSVEELQAEIDELNYKLLESELCNKRKLEFLAYLAHEYKTPLNAIQGFTSLMEEKETDRITQLKYCKNILSACSHLYQIMQYTINTARAESDNINLVCEKFSPSEVIYEIAEVLSVKIKQKNIKLEISAPKDEIYADKRRFKQLIYNLFGNAYKFNKTDGEIEIKSFCTKENYYFEISDTGCGIPLEKQNKVFDFFNTVNENRFKGDICSGMGLSLCKKIINMHGGKINFKSSENIGSIFWFYIPITQQDV